MADRMKMVTGAGGQQFPVAVDALDEQTRAAIAGEDVGMSLNPMPYLERFGSAVADVGGAALDYGAQAIDALSFQEPAMAAEPQMPGMVSADPNAPAVIPGQQVNPGATYDSMAGVPESQQFVQPAPAGTIAPGMTSGQVAPLPTSQVPSIDTSRSREALSEFEKGKTAEADALSKRAERTANEQMKALEREAEVEQYMQTQRELAQQRIAETSEKLQKLNNEIEEFEIESPSILGKTAGDKVLASLSLALGNIGSALMGRKSTVLDILKANVEKSINRQKQQLGKKEKSAQQVKSGLEKAMERFDDLTTAEAAMKKAVYDKLARRIEIIENQTESPRVRANAQVAKAEMQKEIAKQEELIQTRVALQMQNQVAAANRQREVIKSQPQNRLIASGFAARMIDAEDVFKDLEKRGFNRADVTSGLGAMLPNVARSSESLMQDQAERNFVNAVLRQESGAAIAQSEFENAVRQYFPRAGDSQEVLKQKAENRKTAIASMAAAGGRDNLANIAVQLGKDPNHYTDRDYVKRMNKMLGARPAE